MTKLLVQIPTEMYDSSRFGLPSIGLMERVHDRYEVTHRGEFIGDVGRAGILQIYASEGDVLVRRQSDKRPYGDGNPFFYKVQASGSCLALGSNSLEAYKVFNNSKSSAKDLTVEREKPINRIDGLPDFTLLTMSEAQALFESFLANNGTYEENSHTLRRCRRDSFPGDDAYIYYLGITRAAFDLFCKSKRIHVKL